MQNKDDELILITDYTENTAEISCGVISLRLSVISVKSVVPKIHTVLVDYFSVVRRAINCLSSGILLLAASLSARSVSAGTSGSIPYQIISGRL